MSERDEMGRFLSFRAYAERYAGETGFAGPHGGYIRACAAADEMVATLSAAVLRYARHDRECPYPDHDCSCGLAPIITPLLGANDYRVSQAASGRATRALMRSLRVCCGQPDTCERDCPLDGEA